MGVYLSIIGLVHGEGGNLVSQIGNSTECALLGKCLHTFLIENNTNTYMYICIHIIHLHLHTLSLGFLIELGIHYDSIRNDYPKESFTKQFTFNSKRKSMSTVIPLPDNRHRLLVKGASEIVLKKCTHIMTNTGDVSILSVHMMM